MSHPWSGGRGGGARGGRGGGGWRGGAGAGPTHGGAVGGARDAAAFAALASADGLVRADAYVSCDQWGPLIRMWIQDWDGIEVHLHLDELGERVTAANVRDKAIGRGSDAHGTPLSPTLRTALHALATAGGITKYHQELRAIGWHIGGGVPMPPGIRAARKGRYLAWGAANGESAMAAHPHYNPSPTSTGATAAVAATAAAAASTTPSVVAAAAAVTSAPMPPGSM
jgi:hypothetical protein